MTALQIVDVKDFMNKLLYTDLFDHFLLPEGSISTGINYIIDGRLNPDYYSPEDEPFDLLKQETVTPFSLVRGTLLSLIKGPHTPLAFKLVFQLSPENQRRTVEKSGTGFRAEDITGMFLNLRFSQGKLICTTGISYRTFSMDKSLEQEWSRLITIFFKNHKIPFEIL